MTFNFKSPSIKPFKLKFGMTERILVGGPYFERPADHLGIKMAVEIPNPCDIYIPTEDYSIPSYEDLDNGVYASLLPIARGRKVYFGCWGGIGRSGLYAAALTKALGIPNPIQYVRANFKPHAVETAQQMEFIENYKPSRKTILTAAIAKAVALAYG